MESLVRTGKTLAKLQSIKQWSLQVSNEGRQTDGTQLEHTPLENVLFLTHF